MEDLIKYYTNLLIVQYHDCPKAKATIRFLTMLLFVNLIFLQIQNAFDWKTAEGKQLDIIGKWVGCTRFYSGRLFDYQAWFSLINWAGTTDLLQGGFSDFSNFNTLSGGFLDYQNSNPAQNQLDDTSYRIMIGLKIIKNSINHTAKNIDDAIWNYFEGRVYTVWSNNELAYYYPEDLRDIMLIAAYKDVLPVPTGIRLELREIE